MITVVLVDGMVGCVGRECSFEGSLVDDLGDVAGMAAVVAIAERFCVRSRDCELGALRSFFLWSDYQARLLGS